MVNIVQIIGTAASIACSLVVGALAFFLKKTLSNLEEADKQNSAQIADVAEKCAAQAKEIAEKTAEQIKAVAEKSAAQTKSVEEKLNDLKADLPLLYVTREDFIRIMNRVEDKLDKLLYGSGIAKGKDEQH